MFVSLTQVCVVYIVKEVALLSVMRNRTHARAPQTSKKKSACSFT